MGDTCCQQYVESKDILTGDHTLSGHFDEDDTFETNRNINPQLRRFKNRQNGQVRFITEPYPEENESEQFNVNMSQIEAYEIVEVPQEEIPHSNEENIIHDDIVIS